MAGSLSFTVSPVHSNLGFSPFSGSLNGLGVMKRREEEKRRREGEATCVWQRRKKEEGRKEKEKEKKRRKEWRAIKREKREKRERKWEERGSEGHVSVCEWLEGDNVISS
jgi:hypothetical protein